MEKLKIIEDQEAAMRVTEEEPEIDVDLFDEKDVKLFMEEEEVIDEPLPEPVEVETNTPEEIEQELEDE